ncbi:hypothetical protein H6B10_17700, partial [Gemmiger formicilis]|nr:hypothetical protein [Gemmiger formicilis]
GYGADRPQKSRHEQVLLPAGIDPPQYGQPHTGTGRQTDDTLEFELHANAQTLPKWPYAFVLRSTFVLEGETV